MIQPRSGAADRRADVQGFESVRRAWLPEGEIRGSAPATPREFPQYRATLVGLRASAVKRGTLNAGLAHQSPRMRSSCAEERAVSRSCVLISRPVSATMARM